MTRTLAIDFGEKRIGLALSDPEGTMALPHGTLNRTSDRQAVQAIADLVRRQGIERVVLGEPRNLDGSRGPAAERASRFAAKLEAATGVVCELVDESLTSVEAAERLRRAGIDPNRHPDRIDAIAAQILLEQALDPSGDRQR